MTELILAGIAGMVALAVAWFRGRQSGVQSVKDKAAADYSNTAGRMRNADTGSGNADDDLKWLHDRGHKR